MDVVKRFQDLLIMRKNPCGVIRMISDTAGKPVTGS